MTLRARRFRYDAVLEQCLAGTYQVGLPADGQSFESGRHVAKVQAALLDVGVAVPLEGVYDPATAAAVADFQAREGIDPPDGVLDQRVMSRLDDFFAGELGPAVPPPGPGEMSVDDFLEAVQAAESGFSDSPVEFLTRLRQMYYPGPEINTIEESKFDRLMPDAPVKLPDGSRRLILMGSMDVPMWRRLTQKAYENAVPPAPPDNPSPYVVDLTGGRVDIGHLLLTLEALIHPKAGQPYSDYGVPAIDPASWVADVGIAAVWAEKDGVPGAPRRLSRDAAGRPDLDGWWAVSAPPADLAGDVDGFNVAELWTDLQGPLSRPLAAYYLDFDNQPGGYRRRFRTFVTQQFGNPGDPASWRTDRARWEKRINTFNDLFSDGLGALSTFTPPNRSWAHTPTYLDYFYRWLEGGLAYEMANYD